MWQPISLKMLLTSRSGYVRKNDVGHNQNWNLEVEIWGDLCQSHLESNYPGIDTACKFQVPGTYGT